MKLEKRKVRDDPESASSWEGSAEEGKACCGGMIEMNCDTYDTVVLLRT